MGSFAIFAQNRLPWQRPLRYRKKRSRSIICGQRAFIRCKDCKNCPVDLQIICLREIIKKDDKKRKERQKRRVKYIALSATFAEWAKKEKLEMRRKA